MKKVISKIKKLNWRYILIYFLLFFIIMSLIIFYYIDDLLIIKNYSFLVYVLLLILYFSMDFSSLVLKLFKRNKNKVTKDENRN